MKPTISLRPLGITMRYTDIAAAERYTGVTLYFSKYDSTILRLCRKAKYHNVDHRNNYKQIFVWVCRRKLVFANAALYDEGLNSDVREVTLATTDLVSVEDLPRPSEQK